MMMKQIAVTILGLAFAYLCVAFIEASFDSAEWAIGSRIAAVVFGVPLSGFIGVICK